jgi:hypothetical protein
MIYLLGKETVIKRIDKILEILEGKKIWKKSFHLLYYY